MVIFGERERNRRRKRKRKRKKGGGVILPVGSRDLGGKCLTERNGKVRCKVDERESSSVHGILFHTRIHCQGSSLEHEGTTRTALTSV